MRYGICKLSVVPMRKDASHTSELVSELLFNDIYKIIEESDEWLKIQCMYDSYEGWIRKLQHHEITDNEYKEYISKDEGLWVPKEISPRTVSYLFIVIF